MVRTIFLAGAGGAVGRRLTPLLRQAGYTVFGTTRSRDKADELRDIGAEPVVVDVLDADTLAEAVAKARPDVVIHQLTDLPAGLPPDQMAAATPRNARLRDEGTRNLVQAARAAGARRLIAQSIAWAYAPGPLPHAEDDPLETQAAGARAVSVGGVVALEAHVRQAAGLHGLVLRYGQLYGPKTGFDSPHGATSLHVDAAASAAALAVERGSPGIYNVAEPTGELVTEKAARELGWRADFRLPDSLSGRSGRA